MQGSKNIFKTCLPKGFEIVESVDAEGLAQTSLSFPLKVIFNVKAFLLADKLADWIAQKEGGRTKNKEVREW